MPANTIQLVTDRRQAITIRDGATPFSHSFRVYREGANTDIVDPVIITVEWELWERLRNNRHDQSDVQAIAGQCKLQLGG